MKETTDHRLITTAVALKRALEDLLKPQMLLLSIWPYLIAIILWGLIGWLFGPTALNFIRGWLATTSHPNWINSWQTVLGGAGLFLSLILLWPLVFMTAQVIVALVQIPIMARVVERKYPGLERRNGGTFLGSLKAAFVATAIYVGLWLVTLPLWIWGLPGVIASVLIGGYFNALLYPYDSLSLHTDEKELKSLLVQERKGHLWLGMILSAMQHIPFVNFLMPVYSGLAYLHYDLDRIRASRLL